MSHLNAPWDYIEGLGATSGTGLTPHEAPAFAGNGEVICTVRSLIRKLGRLDQALQQQRRFASDASHELRSPVAGLRAELEDAQLHPDDGDLQETLKRALSAVDRLEAIIADLLLLSRVEASASAVLEPVDLAQLVLTEISHRMDRSRIQLRLVPGVRVNVVRTQIGRVLTNLLDNAERHAKRIVMVEVSRNGRTAELIVSDDGDGIAEKDRKRIFERFARLESGRARDDNGTGLGLAIALEIAHIHHGTLDVGDSLSGGARFTLRLPLDGSS